MTTNEQLPLFNTIANIGEAVAQLPGYNPDEDKATVIAQQQVAGAWMGALLNLQSLFVSSRDKMVEDTKRFGQMNLILVADAGEAGAQWHPIEMTDEWHDYVGSLASQELEVADALAEGS